VKKKNGSLVTFLFRLKPVNYETFESGKFEGNIVPVYTRKSYRRIGVTAPLILNILARLR
jgi:hypothetical protein